MIGRAEQLTIAISTIDLRLLDLARGAFPNDLGFRYLFIVQNAQTREMQAQLRAHIEDLVAPDLATIEFPPDTGLSSSRNEAIRLGKTAYVYFCDDDLVVDAETLSEAVNLLEGDRTIDFVWCRSTTPDGNWRKRYPRDKAQLSLFNVGAAGTPELLFRSSSIRQHNLRFDDRFGAGSRFPQGEEYIFLADLLRVGCRGTHLARSLFTHEVESTGTRQTGAVGLAARAAVLERVFGRLSLPYKLAYVARHRRLFSSPAKLWGFLRPQLSQ